MDDSGLGKPRTMEQRVAELERIIAIIFRVSPPAPNQTEYSVKPKKRVKSHD